MIESIGGASQGSSTGGLRVKHLREIRNFEVKQWKISFSSSNSMNISRLFAFKRLSDVL